MHLNRRMVLAVMLIAALVIPAVSVKTSRSEGNDCPRIVAEALDATNLVCNAVSRNEACYGHVMLEAQAQPDVSGFTFAAAGDLEDVADIRSLRISGMDTDMGVWGIALMRLRANIPDDNRSKNVTLLLFGDVEVENAVAKPALTELTAPVNLNVRSQPDAEAYVLAALAAGSSVIVEGRSSDGEWLHVLLPEGDQSGWVYGSVVMNPDDVLALPVVDSSVRQYQPMQAFYFRSGIDDAQCPEAPDSGLVVQTPEGVASVTFLINEVDIQLGSTVYFQAEPGNAMTVSVVEGSATVRAFGVTSRATAGSALQVPISDDMKASGPPGLPYAYAMASVKALPLQGLERAIAIHEPLTEEELAALIASISETNAAAASGTGSSAGGETVPGGGDGREPIPGGGTANNPVFGENTPGQGGIPPGQEKKD